MRHLGKCRLYLRKQLIYYYRFCCAAASDNRTRLEFHGERRIWDGRSIRRKIKGNSALYILIEKVLPLETYMYLLKNALIY